MAILKLYTYPDKVLSQKCEPVAEVTDEIRRFLDDMLEMSNEISKKFPHLRVDWYGIEGKLYLGELTLYDGSGMCAFAPKEWDSKLGSWIELPHTHTHTHTHRLAPDV